MKRECGGCTACCKTHGVPELAKRTGSWCFSCDTGRGCEIYEARPASCQSYRCNWLNGEGERNDRPDKAGFVMDYIDLSILDIRSKCLLVWEVIPGSAEQPQAIRFADITLSRGGFVCHFLAPSGSGIRFVFPQTMDMIKRSLLKIALFVQWCVAPSG